MAVSASPCSTVLLDECPGPTECHGRNFEMTASELFDLSGRTALITGSSRGIGYTIARGLASAGARVIVNGRNVDRVTEAVVHLRADGFDASPRAFDVVIEDDVDLAAQEIEDELGPIDILVNNAGVQNRQTLQEFSLRAWESMIATNVTGAFLVSRAVARRMIPRGRGKIINVCSLQSELARPGIAPYAATKGALKMLTKGMCADWARHGIQVNGIGPGYFETEMTQPLRDDPVFDQWLRDRTPSGRWGDPEELVGTAIFLASRASDFVNGQIVYVDGGVLAVI
jgi:gluconate 5-dehydrogenase